MKFIEYLKALKTKRFDHEKEVSICQARHKKMIKELQNNIINLITLEVDYLYPEDLIFYNMCGYKILDNDSLIFLDTNTVYKGYEYTQHIIPTYFVIKDTTSTKPASLANTTMYRVTY